MSSTPHRSVRMHIFPHLKPIESLVSTDIVAEGVCIEVYWVSSWHKHLSYKASCRRRENNHNQALEGLKTSTKVVKVRSWRWWTIKIILQRLDAFSEQKSSQQSSAHS